MTLWKDNIYVVILTCKSPKYNIRVKKLKQRLKSIGIDKFHVHVGSTIPSGVKKNSKTLSKCIFGSHYEVVKIISQKLAPTKDIFILEDDCQFLDAKAGEIIFENYLRLKQQYPQWTVFFPGHVPLGPLLPCCFGKARKIVYTTFPYAAHSYIINGQKIASLLARIPKRMWTRPFVVEGWTHVSVSQKFALYPPITTQNQLPKEMVDILKLRQLSKTLPPQIKEAIGLDLDNVNGASLETCGLHMHYLWIYYVPLLIFAGVACVMYLATKNRVLNSVAK